jgi:hypothetical protein
MPVRQAPQALIVAVATRESDASAISAHGIFGSSGICLLAKEIGEAFNPHARFETSFCLIERNRQLIPQSSEPNQETPQ